MYKQAASAMVLSLATVTNAAEPIGTHFGQVFEMSKAMATAPRLYSAAGEENPGKYCGSTNGHICAQSEYSNLILCAVGVNRDSEV